MEQQGENSGMDETKGPVAAGRQRIIDALEQSRDPMSEAAFRQTSEWKALLELARAGSAVPDGTPRWLCRIVETILAAGIGGGKLAGLRSAATAVGESMYEDAECRARVEAWWKALCEGAQ